MSLAPAPALPISKTGSLKPGDLLFRYLPQFDTKTRHRKLFWYRTELFQEIIAVQRNQDVWKDEVYPWCSLVDSSVVHVGIYLENKVVVEVDVLGVYPREWKRHKHYDIVVRLQNGGAIARIAEKTANQNPDCKPYPLKREGIVVTSKTEIGSLRNRIPYSMEIGDVVEELQDIVLTGGWVPPNAQLELKKETLRNEFLARRQLRNPLRYKLRRAVVCSHLAALILYAAKDEGNNSIWVASQQRFDHIFKMTPSHLLHEAYKQRNLCEGAKIVGMQHQGRMIAVDSDDALGELIQNGDSYCKMFT